MRELSTIQKREKLNKVYTVDEKGCGNANHLYQIDLQTVEDDCAMVTYISFQNGARKLDTSTHGIIDTDYYYSDNEGYIFIKLVNDSVLAKKITIGQGEAFCQGIFIPFGITVDDDVTDVRNGGFGSTSR